ncbi:MAG: hypothetical protein EU533_06550, partial [Promethearchaeota archaeon]
MTELEDQIIRKIDEKRDEIIRFHQAFIRIPSENPPSKYKEVAKFVEKKMSEIGLKTTIKRNNVIGELENGEGPKLIFNGHFDTVEAFKGWSQDPFG